MDKKVLYVTILVLIMVWGMPSIFTAVLLWGLLFHNPYTDLVVTIVTSKLDLIQTNTQNNVGYDKPTSYGSLTLLCKGYYKNGNPCRYNMVKDGYCNLHQKII